jgi:hypothetical protein
MRLIDADWVLGHLKPYEQSDEEWSVTGGTALRLIHNAIGNAPTVDAVVVTRCKDCKYLVNATVNANGFLICDVSDMEIAPGDFCSYGEPKEG